MILTACVYPITGLLFVCILSIAGFWSVEVKATQITEGGSSHARPVARGNDVFTSSFLVRFRRSVDNDFAHKVANKYGFENLGAVSICF